MAQTFGRDAISAPAPAADHHGRRHRAERACAVQGARHHVHQALLPQLELRVDHLERGHGEELGIERPRFPGAGDDDHAAHEHYHRRAERESPSQARAAERSPRWCHARRLGSHGALGRPAHSLACLMVQLLDQRQHVGRGFCADLLAHVLFIATPVLHRLGPLAGVVQSPHQSERGLCTEGIKLGETAPPLHGRLEVAGRRGLSGERLQRVEGLSR